MQRGSKTGGEGCRGLRRGELAMTLFSNKLLRGSKSSSCVSGRAYGLMTCPSGLEGNPGPLQSSVISFEVLREGAAMSHCHCHLSNSSPRVSMTTSYFFLKNSLSRRSGGVLYM